MKKLPLVARLILGLIFFVFGLNGFLHFIPIPPMEGAAADFFKGLMATGYFFPLLAGTQVLCGLAFLSGAMVPLALVVIAPVVLNIFMFHVFVDPKGLPMALVVGILELYLSFFAEPYSSVVKQIFRCPMKESMDAKKAS